MAGKIGKCFNTNYTEEDVLWCITSYSVITGNKQPVEIIVPLEHKKELEWLIPFEIEISTGRIQKGTILLI